MGSKCTGVVDVVGEGVALPQQVRGARKLIDKDTPLDRFWRGGASTI